MYDLSKLTVIDTETRLIEPGILAPELACLSSADAKSATLYSAKEAIGVFRGALKQLIGGQNIAFDLGVLCRRDPSLLPEVFCALREGRVLDSMLLEALHAIGSGTLYRDPETNAPTKYPLDYLERRYLGIDRAAEKHETTEGGEPWRTRYGELIEVPLDKWPEDAKAYPKADARGTYDVLVKQLAEGRLNVGCIAHETQAAFALHLCSAWGMRTDPEMVPEVVGEIRRLHEESRKKFMECGIVRVRKCTAKERREGKVDFERDGVKWRYATNKKLLAQKVEIAYKGAPPPTNKGAVSTSRDTLTESGDELLEAFGESGENEKLNSTYTRVLGLGVKVPVNARYQVLVGSGRTSSWDPNIQQLPRKGKVRQCYIPREGNLYLSCDYATQESVALGQIQKNWFGKSALADAINAGQDIHIRMAANFAGGTYADFYARRREPEIKKLRQASKPANFGLPGLLGPPGLVMNARGEYDVRFCEYIDGGKCSDHDRVISYKGRTIPPTCERCLELAADIRNSWLETWPEMQEYLDICIELARECEHGIPFAHQGNGMLRLTDAAGAACNSQFQNLAAQASKHALFSVSEACHVNTGTVLYGNCHPVAFLHDEILAEVRQEVAHECAAEVQRIMVKAMQEYTPDVLVKAEPALCRRWFKAMEPVYGKDGRLKPWWPEDWSWGPDLETMKLDRAA